MPAVLPVVAGAVCLVRIPIVEMQTNAEGRAALFHSIDRGNFHSIAEGKAAVNRAVTKVFSGDGSPILKGDREGSLDSDRGVRQPSHFGLVTPGKGKQRIKAPSVYSTPLTI